MRGLWLTLLIVGLGSWLVVSADAQVMINCDQGLSERFYEVSGKAVNDEIGFVWFPELPPGVTDYVAVGFCRRADVFMFSTGNNKTRFSNASLVGADSGTTIDLPKKTAKMKNGSEKKITIWEITDEARDLAQTESAVFGYAELKMNKTVDAGDYTGCYFGLVEMDSALVAGSASAQERRLAIQELVRQTIVKELKPPVP